MTAGRLLALLGGLGACLNASAIDRAEVTDRARAFSLHPWHCSAANLVASCTSGYQSEYLVGDHLGLPYDWDGFVSLHEFDEDIDQGKAAGSPAGGQVLSCSTGLDCSGLVSQCWRLPIHHGTIALPDISSPVDLADLRPGDILNYVSYHVVLWAGELADGTPVFYEAMPPNVRINTFGGWSWVSGFTPLRYDLIEEGASDLGTQSNPIEITSWPFVDNRDTRDSQSDLMDACGANPATDESGREFFYVFTTTVPGILTAAVSDGAGTDIDIHLYRDLAERDCIARDDLMIEVPLSACGTYHLVADTWVNSSGTELPGPYTLTADFTPTGGACEELPGYDFLGGPGDACASPVDPDQPFCNPNLGVTTCLYSQSPPVSFCSRPCDTDAGCAGDFPGGCCRDIGSGEHRCLLAQFCPQEEDGGLPDAGQTPDGSGSPDGADAGQDPDGTGPPDGADTGQDPDGSGPPDGADAGQDPDGSGPPDGADAGQDPDGTGPPDGADVGNSRDGAADTADPGPCPGGWHLHNGGCVPDDWQDSPASCGCSQSSTSPSAQILFLLLGFVLSSIRSCCRRRTRPPSGCSDGVPPVQPSPRDSSGSAPPGRSADPACRSAV